MFQFLLPNIPNSFWEKNGNYWFNILETNNTISVSNHSIFLSVMHFEKKASSCKVNLYKLEGADAIGAVGGAHADAALDFRD